MLEIVKEMYLDIIEQALPITVYIGLANLVINLFLSAAFGNRIKIGGDK